jgi:hypothetical protein
LKPAREKKITYKGKPIRISADISTETLMTGGPQWYISCPERKQLQTWITIITRYPSEFMRIKTFPNEQKLKTCVTAKPALMILREYHT